MSSDQCIKLAAEFRESIEKGESFALPLMTMKDFSRLLQYLKG